MRDGYTSLCSDAENPPTGPRARLFLRVVDTAGRPVAGLPLVVTRELPAPPPADRHLADSPGTALTATTDAEGRASFADLRRFLREPSPEWTLVHDVTFEEPPALLLTHALLEADTIVSVQPPFGSIEVRASELDGTRARDVSKVTLSLVRRDEGRDPLTAFQRPSFSREAPEGVARFPFVELGRAWDASMRRNASDVVSRAGGDGPLRQGESVVLEVVLGADHPVLALRAVDRAGTPFASVRLAIERFEFFGSSQRFELETDAHGVFTIDREKGWFFGGTLLVTHTASDGAVHSGYANLESSNESGLQEGGDVVLEPAGVLVAGRVVDELGRGVEGARVAAGRNARYDAEVEVLPGDDRLLSSVVLRSIRFWSEPEDEQAASGKPFKKERRRLGPRRPSHSIATRFSTKVPARPRATSV